ncbi:hypothetical protein E4T49_05266 [Aureobasidium sp. EXF-10728]|nr:hypothetical protein E4T49_05266 [Aureobasidium sp. EXF-10728]
MEIVSRNLTANEPPWNSTPAWKMPGWAEPLIVVTILFGSMILTRRRGYRILGRKPGIYTSALDTDDMTCSSDELLGRDESSEDATDEQTASTKHAPKTRRLLNFAFKTPNTFRFKNNIHSRVLKRFPFLLEMFYWVINYAFYRMTAILSQKVFAGRGIWTVAESHGLAILDFEQHGFLSSLFPRELAIQQWFMHNHQDMLSFLNKAYAYIHIPGTVGFIAWYYYVAPSHSIFAKVRRTMNLTNFMAFTTYIFYPCMPPRLLPKEYGFLDTVRHDDGQSVWMSGTFGGKQKHDETGKTWMWKILYVGLGVGYPTMILTSIIATANHYFLDALVAMMYVLAAFMSNKVFCVFVPVEDWLLWAVVTMAEPEVVIDASENNNPAPTQSQDVDMGGQDESTQPENSADPSTEQQPDEPSGLENIEPELPARVTFLDYLKSPIIELSVGKDDNVTLLHAHQRLLEQSPVLADKIAAMTDADNRRIDLPDEDLTATACFLEFLYKNDYFPTLSGSSLETDPEIPVPDTEGMALLRHARVYTLAQHFGVPALATLAHKKIHLTQSTARGEIEYARYVYGHTEVSDESIRKPVAAFWATRSHVLRHEAEKEFRSMCLEFPQFGFDVLSLVLDNQEKRTARSETTIGGGRKRPRVSAV